MTATQEIRNCSSSDMLRWVQSRAKSGSVERPTLVHADPPWQYSGAAPPKHGRATHNGNSSADSHYGGMPMDAIVADLDLAFDVAAPDSYLVVWCTWPTVWEFAAAWFSHAPRWKHLTGGAWGKKGRQGIGFHMLGASEPLLVFRKGRPKPQCSPKVHNLWTTEGEGPFWEERKPRTHSEKPPAALSDIVRLATGTGGHVVDLYAGASASLARQCHLLGRNYLGAELDPDRHEAAVRLLDVIAGP